MKPRPNGRNLCSSVLADHSNKNQFKPVDPKLMEILVERHSQFLRFLQHRLGNRDEAEDVLQDFHLRVLLKGGQIKDGDSIVAWLHTVLRSVFVDYVRKEAKRRDAHQLMASEWLTASSQEDVITSEEEPFDRNAYACIYRLLPSLKAEYADALSRVVIAGQEREEAARELGVSQGNMRVRLHRARNALREELKISCRKCREHDCFGLGE